jgi:hypothetical protein
MVRIIRRNAPLISRLLAGRAFLSLTVYPKLSSYSKEITIRIKCNDVLLGGIIKEIGFAALIGH